MAADKTLICSRQLQLGHRCNNFQELLAIFGFHGRKYCPFCVSRPLAIGFSQPCWKTRGIQFGQPMTYSALFDAKLIASFILGYSSKHQH